MINRDKQQRENTNKRESLNPDFIQDVYKSATCTNQNPNKKLSRD